MLETWFPNLGQSGYHLTSVKDCTYNCVAWAAGDSDRWWEDAPLPGYYWPQEATRGGSIDALASVFCLLGYETCTGDSQEAGLEKVALYVDGNGEYTHAARQLPDGWWTSKIGGQDDIRHRTPHALASAEYGSVMYVMKRPRRDSGNGQETTEVAS